MNYNDQSNPWRPVVDIWLSKIKMAGEVKRTQFGLDAAEAMNYLDGGNRWMWDEKGASNAARGFLGKSTSVRFPTFRMTWNRVSHLVQLFGPAVYHRNPERRVMPRQFSELGPDVLGDPQDPMVQMLWQQLAWQEQLNDMRRGRTAGVMENYLNYTPNELDLAGHSRKVIDEALIKGMGIWWHETYQPEGFGVKLVGSFYDTVDNLIIDPDATHWDDIQWIARRCVGPVHLVEREYQLPAGALKHSGHFTSIHQEAVNQTDANEAHEAKKGRSNDLVEYWKVYSKQGVGHRLKGFGQNSDGTPNRFSALADMLESFGDYAYIVCASGVPYPLNLPPDITRAEFTDDEEGQDVMLDTIASALEWPIPFWADYGGWPFTELAFHWKPNQIWPLSHLKPAAGHIRFLNWAMSFLADKIMHACNTMVGVPKGMQEKFKNALLAQDCPYSIIEIEEMQNATSIRDLVSFIDAPAFHGDIWNIIEKVSEDMDKTLGTPELIYGMAATQSRTAADTNVRQNNASIRVDHMRSQVAAALSKVARKEAFAARWVLEPDDVSPVLGPLRTQIWQSTLMSQPVESIVREFDYRIEAGDLPVPNRMTQINQVNETVQSWAPIASAALSAGQVGPINAMMEEWGEARGLDMSQYLLTPPPPPQLLPPEQEAVPAA